MEHQMGSLVTQQSLGLFAKGHHGLGIYPAFAQPFWVVSLGKRTVEHMDHWSTFPPFLHNIPN
jgi:hypothetical protein